MMRINENGDLESFLTGPTGEVRGGTATLATALQLKAAYAEAGMVLISVEDARAYMNWWEEYEGITDDFGHTLSDENYRAADRLRAAIKEAP